MGKGYLTISILLLFGLFSCQEGRGNLSKFFGFTPDTIPMAVVLQPFDDISGALIDSVYLQIKEMNPNVIINPPVSLPPSACLSSKDQYRADSLTHFLLKLSSPNRVIIGLTSQRIMMTKGDGKDREVMGLAYCPGHSCVVSTHKLSQDNQSKQLAKLAVHELAHTQGIYHCRGDSMCYMRNYEGTDYINSLNRFCRFCKSRLRKKGWSIN